MNFQPKARLIGLFNTKLIVLAAMLVVVTVVCSFSLTGNVTEQEQNQTKTELLTCQTVLNLTVDNLNATAVELNGTKEGLSSCQITIQTAQSDLANCISGKNDLNSRMNTCTTENEASKTSVQNYKDSYTWLANNAAKAICCTPGLTSANWDILNDAVICMGSQTIDCA